MNENKLTQEIELTLKRMSGDYAAELSDEAHELLEFHLTQLLEAKREEITNSFADKTDISISSVFKEVSQLLSEEIAVEVTKEELLAGGWFCGKLTNHVARLISENNIPHESDSPLQIIYDYPVFFMPKGGVAFKKCSLLSVVLRHKNIKKIVRKNDKFYWVK